MAGKGGMIKNTVEQLIGNKQQGHLLKLTELFDGRRFIVPDYQRGYSWEKEQRRDLLSDLEKQLDKEFSHYMGTIVAAPQKKSNMYEIVDGQQRLTSLLILLNVIMAKNRIEQKKREELERLFNFNNSEERVFTLNAEADPIYLAFIATKNQPESTPDKSAQNICDAIQEFKEWVESKENITLFLNIILSKIGFVFFAPEHEKTLGIMFEIINNRGKPLSELEKVKNYLIYYTIQQNLNGSYQRKINTIWNSILQNLMKANLVSNDDENAFLRNCWILFHTKDKSKSYRVYEGMKARFPVDAQQPKAEDLDKFLCLLEQASEAMKDLYTRNDLIYERIGYQPAQASILPLYIASCLVFKSEQELLNKLLQTLEILNFRIYIVPGVTKRADKWQSDLFGAAYSIFQDNWINKSDQNGRNRAARDLITYMGTFIQEKCPLPTLVAELTLDIGEEYDYFHWPGLKYFLVNYEIDLQIRTNRTPTFKQYYYFNGTWRSNDKYHQEHIWALDNKEYNLIEQWHEKRRLGNFMLLEGGINSSISNNSIEEKINGYEKSYLEMVKRIPAFCEESKNFLDSTVKKSRIHYGRRWLTMYTRIIDLNETCLVNWAVKRWKLPSEREIEIEINSFNKGFYKSIYSPPATDEEAKVYRIHKS